MANPFRRRAVLGKAYRLLRQAAQGSERNQISASNELRELFPGTGDTHQLNSQNLTLDDAVLTIAAVLLGVSQIRYPFKIALGDLNFYRSLGRPHIIGQILPDTADAFISPVDLDILARSCKKRKHDDSRDDSASPNGKRRKPYDAMTKPWEARNFALAICEPLTNEFDKYALDLASARPRTTPDGEPTDEQRIASEIATALRSGNWDGAPNQLSTNVRHTARPHAPERYEVHAAILHAWAYILDFPINPRPPRSIAQFDTELLDLFNLALRGQLNYYILRAFLKDTGYLYPGKHLNRYQCIKGKYQRPLWRFRSVEIRRDTEDNHHDSLDIARLSTTAGSIPLRGVRNAIGSLWRATLRPEFSRIVTTQYGFATEHNVSYGPSATAPLMMLHLYDVGGDAPFPYLSTVEIISPTQVHITHFGIGSEVSLPKVEMITERTAKQCGWHGGKDVTKIHFRHVFTSTPRPANSRESALYAIFFAWCLLLGMEMVGPFRRMSKNREVEARFLAQAEAIINSAFAGKVNVAEIKKFLVLYGFANDSRNHVNDSLLVTRVQPASWDALEEYIKRRRATQTPSPNLPDSPSVTETAHSTSAKVPKAPERQEPASSRKCKKSRSSSVEDLLGKVSELKASREERAASKTPSPTAETPGTSSRKPAVTPTLLSKDAVPNSPTPKTRSSKAPSHKQRQTTPPSGPVAESTPRVTRRQSKSKSPSEPTPIKSSSKSSSKSKSSSESKLITPEKSQRRTTPKPKPPAAVLPWGEYRNPLKFHMYNTANVEVDPGKWDWMAEFKHHLALCKALHDARRAANADIPQQRFTDENGIEPADGAQRTIVGDLVVSLWKPLYDCTVKFGLVDIDYVRLLEDKEYSRNGILPAAGGPYPFLMAMHGTSIVPSPEPGSLKALTDMGHIWFAVARIRQEDMLDENDEPTLREATKEHPIHVDVDVYDTMPGLMKNHKTHNKPRGLIRYSGWAVGAREATDNHGQTSLIPRHWEPTIRFTNRPCPHQFEHRATKRTNACGLLTTLHAWMTMLDLPITAKRALTTSTGEFYKSLIEMFDLALAGALTTRTIQAFVNAYRYIAQVQQLTDSVVNVQTQDPALGKQLMEQLVRQNAFYPYDP